MQNISVFLRRHETQPVWIFGKGPSLDSFSMSDAGPVRICINESLNATPNPTYFFAHDEGPIRNVAGQWPRGCCAILQEVRARYAAQCGIPEEDLYVYDKRYADNEVRDMDVDRLAEKAALYGFSGTVHCAIHFCRLIGAAHITLVGFDGQGGYAKRVGLPDGGAAHAEIRRDTVNLLETLCLSYEFFQQTDSTP